MMLSSPCFTVFTVYCGLNSVFGGCLTNCLRPSGPKESNLTFISPQNVSPFLVRPVNMFFGKLYPLSLQSFFFFFFNSGTLWGPLAVRLVSHKPLLIVTVLTGADHWLSLCYSGYCSIHSNGGLLFSSTSLWFGFPF